MDVFTSISLNYLPKARILAKSLKNLHSDWKFHLVISDRLSKTNATEGLIDFAKEPFDQIVWIEELDIPDIYSWIFKHTVVEICTAAKGLYLKRLIKEGVKKIIYLDPDIAVFNSLSPLVTALDKSSILLTPHLLDYSENVESIRDNEILGVLKHGIYNLGFFGLNFDLPEGCQFAEWWGHRLFHYCYADYGQSLFTDQKWCDLVPAYFKNYSIVYDPGYNVASWNIDKRDINIDEKGQILVNNKYPLRFYHFTGYDSGAGEAMTIKYGKGNQIVTEIWDWYNRELIKCSQDTFSNINSFYNYFDNGEEISFEARTLYRERKDLQEAFPNPYLTIGNAGKYAGGYYSWLINNNN